MPRTAYDTLTAPLRFTVAPPRVTYAELDNGRLGRITHRFTNAHGVQLVRLAMFKGFPLTVEASRVVAVWAKEA